MCPRPPASTDGLSGDANYQADGRSQHTRSAIDHRFLNEFQGISSTREPLLASGSAKCGTRQQIITEMVYLDE